MMHLKTTLRAATAAAALLVTNAAQAQTIDYGMLQDAFGQAVTTGATGKPQVQSDAPAAMQIITAEEIKASGLDNLPDILGRVAGVDVVRWGSASADVAVRGYNQAGNPRLLVLVNGRQVYADHYALVTWSAIPVQLSEIRQIEVVKGPVGAIYGFNAVAGVVNIITYNPLYDNAGAATARFGNHGQREIGLSKALKLNDALGARFSAGYKEADEFERGNLSAADRRSLRDPESLSVSGAIMAQVSDAIQAGIELTHSDVQQAEMMPSAVYTYQHFKTTSAKADLTADAGALGLVSLAAYRNWLDFSYSSVGSSDVTTTVVQMSDLIQIGTDHTVKITGEFRHNEMDQFLSEGTGSIGYDVWAASGMWDWKVTPNLSFTNAARVDFFDMKPDGIGTFPRPANSYDVTRTKASFNSGLVFKPSDVDTLRATYGLANQLASLVELGGLYGTQAIAPGVRLYILGNPSLKPSEVTSFELGYSRALPVIKGHAAFSVFRQKTDNLKAFIGAETAIINRVPVLTVVNGGESKSWGAEAEVKGKTDGGLSYGVSYTFTDINDALTVNRGAVPTRPILFEDATPRHKVQGELGYTLGALTAQANIVYQSSRTLLKAPAALQPLRAVEIDGYWTAGGTIAYLFETGTEVRATLTDALRPDTLTNPGLRTERRVYATISQKF
ncbi:hypothetical protein CHU95_00190 [Niveispirillum lacus]|uniref:TonB-dependent receptor n=1 Tax=Niveispirillum lacus TaxID=1981099 RepID=A0A255ZAN1_9PROT|nr:TonB-dependent receptor [Niveispirillum lacus]OYQ37925.1 hypothetical protein CHU95_00190 [Niveispirillum lacus]